MKNDNEIKEKREEELEDVSFEETNDEGEVTSQDTIKKLREKIKTLEKEKQEYLLGWQRANADYANFKKEGDERRKDDIRFASKRLITDLLPTLDAYDMARSNKEVWEKVDTNWRIGIEYIFSQLIATLEKEGTSQYGKVGDIFDPLLHESVELIETKDVTNDGKIAMILQSGYKMGQSILRVARVKVYQKEE